MNANTNFTFRYTRRLEIINPVLAFPALQCTTTTFSMSSFNHEYALWQNDMTSCIGGQLWSSKGKHATWNMHNWYCYHQICVKETEATDGKALKVNGFLFKQIIFWWWQDKDISLSAAHTFPSNSDASYSLSEQRLYTLYFPCNIIVKRHN